VEYVVHSAKMVSERMPEVRFVIAGDGHLRKGLESFSRSLGLEGKVMFTGFVDEGDLASYYAAADVFVSPSFYEPFGITALESLLSGTPAIVGKGSGVLERISSLGCIMAVRPGDSRELARKIMHVLKGRISVSENDKRLVREAYSWERAAKETVRVYRKVAMDRRRI